MSGAARGSGRGRDGAAELRDVLRDAAAEGFARVQAPELGPRLRAAIDALLAVRPEDAELAGLRDAAASFDTLGRQDRTLVVARAMRISAGLTPAVPAKPRRKPLETGTAAVRDDDPVPAIASLPRVGPATVEKLAARGLITLWDLAYLLPRRYLDRRRRMTIAELQDGDEAVIEGRVHRFRQGWGRGRFMATLELVDDEGGAVIARWFHRPGGLLTRVTTGERVILAGTVKVHGGQPGFVHPKVYAPDDPAPPIDVIYPLVEGVPAATIARLCKLAVETLRARGALRDVLPVSVSEAHGLPPLPECLQRLHDPGPEVGPDELARLGSGTSDAHRRLAFEELVVLQTRVLQRRRVWREVPRAPLLTDGACDRERLRACLPFEPTAAQWRVIDEIVADMADGRPMLRLVQGDVGSGKTAVAFAAALAVTAAGGQVAIMAPTEVLAEQHRRTWGPWCEAAGLRLASLTGNMPRAQRTSLLSLLGAGNVDVLVGTHALIVGDVTFARLGLVVVDEQHRFGVEQRARLRDKGVNPHLLVMTATPIPRTLALTAYGELDVSTIDELPPGRTPPLTRAYCGAGALTRARATLANGVRKGAQAFVVCPLVESSEHVDVTDVHACRDALAALLPEHRIGLVHGRLPPREKDEVMNAFRERELDVLVATTVIEVGVDVPGARAILVEHAERFGLAQLHQLRGRVGRSTGPSACLLHTAFGPASEAAQRLEVLVGTHDGFVVAEKDLELRGPGEVFGTRQAGVPRLRFFGFAGEGSRMLSAARHTAEALLAEDPDLARWPDLQAAVARVGDATPTTEAG